DDLPQEDALGERRFADFTDRLAVISLIANEDVDLLDREILKLAVGDFLQAGIKLLDENVMRAGNDGGVAGEKHRILVGVHDFIAPSNPSGEHAQARKDIAES